MDLRITTTHGLIGINTTPGKMNIEYGKSNFNLETKNPKIDMQITQPKVDIDITKPLAEIGLKKISDFIKTNAEESKQVCSKGIARIVQQGNQLASIETGNKVIPMQAKYNAFDQSKKEVNIGFIPKSRPEINLKEGSVNISLDEGEVDITSKPQEVSLNLNRGKVEIYLRQKPSIDIEYIGKNLDMNI